jgi:hypothetical protein
MILANGKMVILAKGETLMIRKILLAAAAGAAAVPAAAAINLPVPTNAYISFGGLDWAWASPCSPTGCNGNPAQNALDLSFQGTLGWRLPTMAELAAAPTSANFVFAGANIPNGGADGNGTIFTGTPGGDAACAVAYFTNQFYNHCDYNDGAIGAVFGLPGYPGEANVETWVVRGVIPEPATWAMLIAGFGLVGTALRRRTAFAA